MRVPFGIQDGDSSASIMTSKEESLLCCLIGSLDPFRCLSVTGFSFSRFGGGRVVQRCWVNFQCRGVLLIWIRVGQGPPALAGGAGGGCVDIFSLVYHCSFLSPSLWGTARYRLKYCLKGPLSPKQPTNQFSRFSGSGDLTELSLFAVSQEGREFSVLALCQLLAFLFEKGFPTCLLNWQMLRLMLHCTTKTVELL